MKNLVPKVFLDPDFIFRKHWLKPEWLFWHGRAQRETNEATKMQKCDCKVAAHAHFYCCYPNAHTHNLIFLFRTDRTACATFERIRIRGAFLPTRCKQTSKRANLAKKAIENLLAYTASLCLVCPWNTRLTDIRLDQGIDPLGMILKYICQRQPPLRKYLI